MPAYPKKRDYLFSGIIFFVFFCLYLKTACPTVFWWDSGEFIANVATLGIPHRPSFPIYVLLARVFTFLAWGDFIFKMNLFSALCAAASLGFCYLIFIGLLETYLPGHAASRITNRFCGTLVLFLLSFTYSFWIQAVRTEVYALCFLFITYVMFLLLSYARTKQSRYLFLSAFVFGLGLGNHHVILVSVLPALILLTVSTKRRIGLPQILPMCLLILAGLSIYLYLPIRSISHPALSWGNPKNPGSVFSSALAWDALRRIDLGSIYNVVRNFPALVEMLCSQLGPLGFAASILGLMLLLGKSLKLTWFILAMVVGNSVAVLLVVSHFFADNLDLHGYLLPCVFGLALSFGMGASLLLTQAKSALVHQKGRPNLFRIILIIGLPFMVLISLSPFRDNISKADLSKNRLAYRYVTDAVKDIPKGSVIFVDNVNFDFVYRGLRFGAKFREDLMVINRSFLAADWYFVQQSRLWPKLYQGIPQGKRGEALFGELLSRCLAKNMPVYAEFTENDYQLSGRLIPHGAFFLVSKSPHPQLSPELLKAQEKWESGSFFGLTADKTKQDIDAQRTLVLWLYRQGLFYQQQKLPGLARDKFEQALKFDPESEELKGKLSHLE